MPTTRKRASKRARNTDTNNGADTSLSANTEAVGEPDAEEQDRLTQLIEDHGYQSDPNQRRCFRQSRNDQCLLVAGHGEDGDAVPHVFRDGRDGPLYSRL